MALDDLRVTDADIEGTIKVAPPGTALDPNKTKGAAHRTLLKKLRDYLDALAELVTGLSFTPIAENQYGTHPAFANQHDLNAYLLSGGTYTPPTEPATVAPVSNLTATPQSSTSILLNWQNPA